MGEALKLPIGELFDIEKGSLQSLKNSPGEYDFITAAEEWKTHNEFSHDIEALIFAAAASGSLGRTHYVNGKFITSDLCYILTPKNPDKYPIDLKFYHFVFNSLKEEIVQATKSGTSKEAINQKSFKSHELPYFDIQKQHLWIQKLVNTKQYQQELLSELLVQKDLVSKLRQSILQEAIEGKLTVQWRHENPDIEPSSKLIEKIRSEIDYLIETKKIKKEKSLPPISQNEILFDVPNNWEWIRLGYITNIVRGGSPRPAGDKRYYDGDIPFLKVADLTKDNAVFVNSYTYTIKEAGLHKTRFVEGETLMLTNSGATLGIPKICNFPTTFNDGIAAFIYMNEFLDKRYLYYFLKSKTNWFLTEAARGQGQPNLNTDIIGNTLIALPPAEEQNYIVKEIEIAMAICDELEQHIEISSTNAGILMQAVLKEAFEQ